MPEKSNQENKRKRAPNYEERLSINTSFDNAIGILLGASAKDFMTQISSPIVFSFKKTNLSTPKTANDFEGIFNKSSIKIPITPIGNICIKIKVLTAELMIPKKDSNSFTIQILAANIIKTNPFEHGLIVSNSVIMNVDPNKNKVEQEKTFVFNYKEQDGCNYILVDCLFKEDRMPDEIKLSFEVFKVTSQNWF